MEDRLRIFQKVIRAALFLLVLQCLYLQVIRFPHYRRLSERNCIRIVEFGIPRGEITDRNGRTLAIDRTCFNLVFSPYDLKNPRRVAELLTRLIGADLQLLLEEFSSRKGNPFDRFVLKRNLTQEEISKIEEYAFQLPGVFVQAGIDRTYPLGTGSCHLLGYLGEVSQEQIDSMKEERFKPGDRIGQYGLEKLYDVLLRGKAGGYQVEVDALGHQRRVLGKTEMTPGNSLILTIDQSIQEAAAQELEGKAGSVVAMDPRSGEILALVSSPGFDSYNIAKALRAPRQPFLNRVVAGQYPPGSIFKIVTETAGLELGLIGEHDRVECSGEMTLRDRVFHCWKEGGHGWVDVNLALPYSCNIFFGTLGMNVGARNLLDYAKLFDLGKKTGIDIPGEKPGHLPSVEESGGSLNLAIGQGALLTTPLQMCQLIAVVANGGNIWKPFVVKKILDPNGKIVKEFSQELKKTVFISEETLAILRKGLKNVVIFGTGASSRISEAVVAGKTGTAQTAHRDFQSATYGGFACYADAERPTIALVVFLDNAGSGQAARIAGRILRKVFNPESAEATSSETTVEFDDLPDEPVLVAPVVEERGAI
ncbi:MAG: penicillin-binding protein 2 [Candidatus Ratteibacteria bacterium]